MTATITSASTTHDLSGDHVFESPRNRSLSAIASEPSPAPCLQRTTMNGKPVLYRDAKTVLTLKSTEFQHKLLCDGITMNLGDACAFSCTYCYVGSAMQKIDHEILDRHNAATEGSSAEFQDVVIRRRDAIDLLKKQLFDLQSRPKYLDPADTRILYSSTLVDVAGNMELMRETAEACRLILENTHWQIRLLSKSNLLPKLAELIDPQYHQRLILGVSTGTLDDRVAAAIEPGTANVTKRIKSLHWLQDHGFRTFGMICPSLPQDDYDNFSREMAAAIRVDRCEHVWAEVINLRGQSLVKTLAALDAAGLRSEAERLSAVMGNESKQLWEKYARDTFLAHQQHIPADKLRFLQYVTVDSLPWWQERAPHGAVLLGKVAKAQPPGVALDITSEIALMADDSAFLTEREKIVEQAVKASIAAGKALHEIHTYRDGILWRDHGSFAKYCAVRWGYAKAHSYRLAAAGEFVTELERSPIGDSIIFPRSESQIRPLLNLPPEKRVEFWQAVACETAVDELTAKTITAKAREFLRGKEAEVAVPNPGQSANGRARKALAGLRRATKELTQAMPIEELLAKVEALIS